MFIIYYEAMKKVIIWVALVPFILTSCSSVSSNTTSASDSQSSLKSQDEWLSTSLSDEKLQAGITKKTQTKKQKKKKYDSQTRAS